MSPITNDTVTLRCPFPDGSNAQHIDYVLADFDAEHASVPSPTLTVTNSQTSIVEVTVNPDGLGPLVVRVKTKAPRPNNITAANITISDGRTKLDGTPVNSFTITVQLIASPDASSLELAMKGPVVDD